MRSTLWRTGIIWCWETAMLPQEKPNGPRVRAHSTAVHAAASASVTSHAGDRRASTAPSAPNSAGQKSQERRPRHSRIPPEDPQPADMDPEEDQPHGIAAEARRTWPHAP